MLALCQCCGIASDPKMDDGPNAAISASWPPADPPTFRTVDGVKMIAGYLKRLNKPNTPEEKWVVR